MALRFIEPDHSLTVNIKDATTALDDAVAEQLGKADLGDFNRGNVKARLRMTAQYALAGEVGARNGSRRRKCHRILHQVGRRRSGSAAA